MAFTTPICSRICRRGRLWLFPSSRLGFVPHSSASQKVDAAIMSDAEQPRFERAALVELVQLSICLERAPPARRPRHPSPNPSCEHSSDASSDAARRWSRERRRSARRRGRRNTWTNYPACYWSLIDRSVNRRQAASSSTPVSPWIPKAVALSYLGSVSSATTLSPKSRGLSGLPNAARNVSVHTPFWRAYASAATWRAGCADDLAHKQCLKPNAEVEIARHTVRVTGHHPHRSLCAGVTTREWRTLNRGSAR